MPMTDEARRPVAPAGADPVPIGQVATRKKRGEPEDFYTGGSDLGGTVYAAREEVQGIEVGDHVVTHPGGWDADIPGHSPPWIR